MLENVTLFCHNSIKLTGSKIIYIDPYLMKDEPHDADFVFCTHGHYDHFSEEDILKVINENTKLITTEDTLEMAKGLIKNQSNILIVLPNKEYSIDDLNFATTPAYNKEKAFHPKENNWVGYIINLDDEKYYIAGDTDALDELTKIECDMAFLPVGGKYTMNYEEAGALANSMKAKIIIPTHYGSIIGNKEDGIRFSELVKEKEVKALI